MNEIMVKPAFDGYGVSVTARCNNMRLDSFSTDWMLEHLKDYGAIVFKDFAVDLRIFTNFINKHSSRVTSDPARKAATQNAQLISAGDVEMGLHVENGNLPFMPDAQWFYCEKAASKGSQTTLCDGIKTWNELSGKTKKQFLTKRVQFSRKIPEFLWKKYLATELDLPIDSVSSEQLIEVNQMVDGQHYQLMEDGSVYSRYKTWAVHPTQFANEMAFANSMLGPSVNYEPPRITWEDGSVIAPSIWDEIIEVTKENTDNIEWDHGDVVVLDNTRVMHGRRKILDQRRRMYGGQSYLRKD